RPKHVPLRGGEDVVAGEAQVERRDRRQDHEDEEEQDRGCDEQESHPRLCPGEGPSASTASWWSCRHRGHRLARGLGRAQLRLHRERPPCHTLATGQTVLARFRHLDLICLVCIKLSNRSWGVNNASQT